MATAREPANPHFVIAGLDIVETTLSSSRRWTRGAVARNRIGKTVSHAPDAVRWCLTGAVKRLLSSEMRDQTTMALSAQIENKSIAVYNDRLKTKFVDIKAFIRKTREQAEKEIATTTE